MFELAYFLTRDELVAIISATFRRKHGLYDGELIRENAFTYPLANMLFNTLSNNFPTGLNKISSSTVRLVANLD